jgi:hypothetical protein
MATPTDCPPASAPAFLAPPAESRYALPDLLSEVNRDRATANFAMEKLDQTTINLLFAQQRARRDTNPGI